MELVGRLTADAKLNSTKSEKKVVNFSVAVNDSYKPRGSDQTVKISTFFSCSYWVNPAIVEYLIKGTLVELSGRVSVNAWNNAEGEAKASLNFHVKTIKLHGKPRDNKQAESKLENDGNTSSEVTAANGFELTKPLEDLPF